MLSGNSATVKKLYLDEGLRIIGICEAICSKLQFQLFQQDFWIVESSDVQFPAIEWPCY